MELMDRQALEWLGLWGGVLCLDEDGSGLSSWPEFYLRLLNLIPRRVPRAVGGVVWPVYLERRSRNAGRVREHVTGSVARRHFWWSANTPWSGVWRRSQPRPSQSAPGKANVHRPNSQRGWI